MHTGPDVMLLLLLSKFNQNLDASTYVTKLQNINFMTIYSTVLKLLYVNKQMAQKS
jgi:hypothetical protein